jgi:hypothetical protein
MGQTLCACAGRADDEPHGLYRSYARPLSARKGGARSHLHSFHFKDLSGGGHDSSLLQTQSRTETRELLSDEEREAIRNSVRVIHASGNYHHVHHAAGVYGYMLPHDDQDHATESDEAEYYSRQQQQRNGLTLTLPARRRAPVMNQATLDAFRTKLREPIMSPRSKMAVLVNGGESESEDDSSESDDDAEQGGRDADDAGATAGSPAVLLPLEDETSSDHDLRRLRCESGLYDVDPAADNQEEEEEEEYFEYARIIVPPGPCGVVFQTPTTPSMPPTVEGFVRMYDGAKGPIENSAMVKVGSTLCAINDLEVEKMALPEVIRALNLSSHLEREFVFRK